MTENNANTEASQILLEQYKIYAQLYQHEDNLTWTKLQRLLVLSAASYSRPPASCPERRRECYRAWRRVEIIPQMSAVQARARMDGFVEQLSEL